MSTPRKPVTLGDLEAFLAARLAEEWSAARDRELAKGLDESRATRRVDAGRAILGLHADCVHECPGHDGYAWYGDAEAPWCPTLRTLGVEFSDHPDYREEWKP